jgi:hypothetical protein
VIEEIVAGPAPASGIMLARLPPSSFSRRITGIAVTSTSTTQTVATVHVDSIYAPYVDATTTGNGDADGASGISVPPGATLIVRWLSASPGSEGRAMVGWERV